MKTNLLVVCFAALMPLAAAQTKAPKKITVSEGGGAPFIMAKEASQIKLAAEDKK